MSRKTKIWSAILLGCLLLTVCQIPSFIPLWREYYAMEYFGQSEGTGAFNTSLIDPEAAEADPEAADILRYLVTESGIDELASLVLKYPDNQFLLFELADRLRNIDALNPQSVLNLADRLVNLYPENAHYHYFKACVLLTLGTEAAFAQAIHEIETGNASPECELPYNRYKGPVDMLLQETKTGTLQTQLLKPHESRFYFDLRRKLGDHLEAFFKSQDQRSSLELTDMALLVGDKLMTHVEDPGLLMHGSLFISTSYLKLKYATLSPEKAEQVRFDCARAVAVRDIVGTHSSTIFGTTEMIMAAIPASATFLALLAFSGLFWILTLIITLIRKGTADVRVSFKKYLQYGSSLICYFVFVNLPNHDYESPFVIRIRVAPTEPDYLYLLLLILPLALWTAFRLMSLLAPYDRKKLYRFWLHKAIVCAILWFAWLALNLFTNYEEGWQDILYVSTICSIVFLTIWAISVYGWFLMRLIPYGRLVRSRGVHLILATAFLAGLTQLLLKVNWLPWLPSILLIPCSAIIIAHRRSGKIPLLVDALYGFFSKREEMAATRAKILRLIPPYIVIFWLIFLVLAGLTATQFQKVKTTIAYPLANLKELPAADKSTYESILREIDFSNVDNSSLRGAMNRSNAFGYLPMLGPNDLPTILAEAKKAKPPATDSDLLNLLERCGPDVRDIIVKSLEEPESVNALIARAKSGDTPVKATLEQLFDKALSELNVTNTVKTEGPSYGRFDPRRRTLSKCFDIASGLARLSEPNEAMTRLMNILDKIDLTAWQDERLSTAYCFYNSLDSLPGPQASRLLKVYLQRTDYSDLSSKENLLKLENALALFSDSEIAEQVFIRTCESSVIEEPLSLNIDINSIPEDIREQFTKPRDFAPKFRKAISPYFSRRSMPVLGKERDADNPDLCAYVVWQLTRLGYEWSAQELKDLLDHENWKVRLNTLFTATTTSVQEALDDESPVVRITAKLLLDN